MNKLANIFEHKTNNLLNIYVTAGYPAIDDLPQIINYLSEAGVDIVEIGMPYSDPLADGDVIQKTSTQALKNGMTVDLLFEQIGEARSTTEMPFIIMGYFNQMLQYGVDRYLDNCQSVGVDGLIIPDLPPDIYGKEFKQKFEQRGISKAFLITPQTTPERIVQIDQLTSGFIYMVSDNSITGAEFSLESKQLDYFQRIKDMDLSSPTMIGFGIHDKAGYKQACTYSSGAIIGSAFLKHLDQNDLEQSIKNFVSKIR